MMRKVSAAAQKSSARSKTLALFAAACLATSDGGAKATSAALPPSRGLHFSSAPRDVEFLRTGLFAQPLVPVGATFDDENRLFSRALVAYSESLRNGADADAVAPLTEFLTAHPSSAWKPALLLDLGSIYRQGGHFSRALTTWQEAWRVSKDLQDPNGRALGDASAAALSQFEAYLGRKELLAPLLQEAERRSLHGTAAELISESARGLADMNHAPEISFKCGPMALKRILQSTSEPSSSGSAITVLEKSHSTPNGLSLTAVQRISAAAGMSYQTAFRNVGAQVVIPSVVHWKVGHYAAIVRKDELGRYRVEDPTFGENVRMRPETLDEEASGYFLVPRGALPEGWRSVDAAEGEKVWGRGNTGTNKDNGATGPGENGAFDGDCPGGCTSWNVEAMVVGLSLHDVPTGYKPPVGPEVRFQLDYSQRDVQQPAIFTYANFGPKWTTIWLSYVTDNIAANGTVDLYRRGGGDEPFTFDAAAAASHPGVLDQSVLTRRTDAGGATTGFSRQLNDGSIEDFSQAMGKQFFMTSVADPRGNKISITYDGQLRITKLTDAIGQDTILSYELAGDPLKVTDPFGRAASFTYNGAGELASITDVLGITSSYVYGTADFVQKLTTPYGSTTFTYGDALTDATLASMRFIEATDPLGRTSRVEFSQDVSDVAFVDADGSRPG